MADELTRPPMVAEPYVDRTLIRHALSLTVEERLISLEQCLRDLSELHQAAIEAVKR
jgi:hypothetical protein